MAETIHRNFPRQADAEAARSALLAAGFPAAAISLNSHHVDPATVSSTTKAVSNVIDALTPGAAVVPSATTGPAALLSVDTDDDEQQARASAIMHGFSASEA